MHEKYISSNFPNFPNYCQVSMSDGRERGGVISSITRDQSGGPNTRINHAYLSPIGRNFRATLVVSFRLDGVMNTMLVSGMQCWLFLSLVNRLTIVNILKLVVQKFYRCRESCLPVTQKLRFICRMSTSKEEENFIIDILQENHQLFRNYLILLSIQGDPEV